MFDARYFAYTTIAALLVISPGATMAVVTETAIGEGRLAALYTVLGVGIGNSSLALASALGMSVVFAKWPAALQVVKAAGAVYLAYLGLRGLWFACRPRSEAGAAPRPVVPAAVLTTQGGEVDGRSPVHHGAVVRGIMTNILNPPVILFYMTFLPQFIGPHDGFFPRFLVLAATHVSMSLAWLSFYAAALGMLADRLARPMVRRALEGLTGVVLIGLGARLLVR
jgi:threonine/homoserine/homoserine lactone efflux protein